MPTPRALDALPPRPDASPGLLRRRYSVPETIMRKYRLAQLRSDSDDSAPASAPFQATSAVRACRPLDRELMRKSPMLRRLWTATGHSDPPCCCCDSEVYDSHPEYEREARSLGSSRAELRHSRSPPGWASPKRQRLDPRHAASDEMLRTAVRNSYQDRGRRDEQSDITYRSHNRGTSSGDGSHASPECVDDQPRKKRRQSVCIYMNSLDSPSAEIKSETVTDTSSSSAPRSSQQTEGSITSIAMTDTSSSQVCSDSSTGLDSTELAQDNQVNRTESSSTRSDDEPTIMTDDKTLNTRENNEDQTIQNKTKSKLGESTMEILEIVVSETGTSNAFNAHKDRAGIQREIVKSSPRNGEIVKHTSNNLIPIDLDQYVSNILVESLNSLSDQLEEMNASIPNDHKICIVEKEIKVKLQNTGMNTIVHLSPNSNNQIIFGNEELFDAHIEDIMKDTFEDKSRSDRGTIKIELTDSNDFRLTDSSENITHISAKELENDNELSTSVISNENINKSVMQQIQKLFQEGLDLEGALQYPGRLVPEISHIEISNVDVFIDENSDPNFEVNDKIEINTNRGQFDSCLNPENAYPSLNESVLGEVGTGTYYKEPRGSVLVPRFSAFPNTESMEVNTSSSEDVDGLGSDCTSLVDSLDDPNSPRNIVLRRACRNSRRSELVRSAIDVLDLLPEMSHSESRAREKSETFFIRIRDDDCDCEKENVVVADHMPDKIRQRLYRRHRKRELRMEYAKRKKVKQIKRELEKQSSKESIKSKKEIEKDCAIILQSLIDEVLGKIVEEEHQYMKIKNHGNKNRKPSENTPIVNNTKISKRSKDVSNLESFKVSKKPGVTLHMANNNKSVIHKNKTLKENHRQDSNKDHQTQTEEIKPRKIKNSRPEYGPKRFYQKSEIHDGKKCIEILEILEYVDSSSSPDIDNNEENYNAKSRKSKIPVPVYESIHKLPRTKYNQNTYNNLIRSSPNLKYDKSNQSLIQDMSTIDYPGTDHLRPLKSQRAPIRRASVPQQDSLKSRSNSSLRFKQVFDIIPEEKSSLSIESSNEDINLNRRVSTPLIVAKEPEPNNNNHKSEYNHKTSAKSKSTSTSPSLQNDSSIKKSLKTVGTSPMPPPKEDNSRKDKKGTGAKKSLASVDTKEGWVGFYEPGRQLLEDQGTRSSRRTHIH